MEPGDLRRLADHIVGPAEIADLLGVHANTINAWKVRDLGFPTPIRRLRGIDLWDRREVLAWAERTGRYPRSEPGDGWDDETRFEAARHLKQSLQQQPAQGSRVEACPAAAQP